jgi:peptide/nickel transport system permease protein
LTAVPGILARRLLQALLVALFVSSACFLMVRFLPGDMAFQVAGGRFGQDLTTAEAAEAIRAELRLDQPVWQAWLAWLQDLARLDFGYSWSLTTPVTTLVGNQLGHTLELSAAALLLSVLIGVPLGVWAGVRPGGLVDRIGLAASVVLRSMPPFVIGVALILVFAVTLRWLPAAGHTQAGTIVLPALTLALGLAAVSSRVARTAMVDVARSDYFQFARTKGLTLPQTVWRHGVRNISVPLLAHLGMQLIYLVEGVIIVETLFAWPGIGHAMSHAVRERDVPMIQGTVLATALMFVLFNAVLDLLQVLIDPRLRTR